MLRSDIAGFLKNKDISRREEKLRQQQAVLQKQRELKRIAKKSTIGCIGCTMRRTQRWIRSRW